MYNRLYHLVLLIVGELDELLLSVPVLVLVMEDGPEDPRIVRRKTDAVAARGPVGFLRLKALLVEAQIENKHFPKPFLDALDHLENLKNIR